jgi:hypothetical protein
MEKIVADLIQGVPGTDAASTKHGYYYQDVVTALAWAELRPGEILQVEVAEDISRSASGEAVVEQVRHVAAKLTLLKALPFIERVIQLTQLNKDHEKINFIYRTTASVALEKKISHQVNGEPSINYWMQTHEGADPAPLLKALKSAAAKRRQLAQYLDSKTDDEITFSLIKRIVWATYSLTSDALKKRLEDKIATLANEHSKCSWSEGVSLVPAVLTHVYEISFKKNEHERQLNFSSLRVLIENLTSKRVGNEEYLYLVEKARVAENAPVEVIDAEVRRKLRKLRLTRFLDESAPVETARELAVEVNEGGQLALAHNNARSDALAWCARLLAENDRTLSIELLKRARTLHDSDLCKLVDALLISTSDPDLAMSEIRTLSGQSVETVRYGIARRQGQSSGWEWVVKAEMTPSDFDADGNYLILHDHLKQENWPEALRWWEKVPIEHHVSSPSLLWVGAHIVLSVGVQEYAKGRIGLGPPTFNEIGLKDANEAIYARRTASEMFRKFSRWAREMGLIKLSEASLEYCLWLELEDRLTNAQAVAEVKTLWDESGGESRWLPLALRAGISVNQKNLIEALDKRAFRNGSLSFEDARARMALAMALHPKHWIDAWPSVKKYLAEYFSADALDIFEVEGLSISGKISEARQLIVNSVNLTEELKNQWLSTIAQSPDDSALDMLRKAVELEDSPANKIAFLKALKKANRKEDAAIVASQLFSASQNHEDAEEYLRLLASLNRWTEIAQFLDRNPSQLEQSHILTEMYLDALFRQGRWKDVLELAESNATFSDRRDNIQIQVAIYSGEWSEIGLQLESAAKDRTASTEEILQLAQLSASLGRHALAKGFCLSAVRGKPDDPAVLMNCYWLAVRGRWDDQVDAISWLQRAADLSGEEGPIYKKSIADLAEMAPKWREREQKIAIAVSRAEVFLGMAAIQLNRAISSLTLENIEWNLKQTDPRSRIALSANSGIKREALPDLPGTIALDQTALLFLGKLGLLERLIPTFSKIYVPHSTGAWLFYESNEIQFHQPSKIQEAERLIELVSAQKVAVARRSTSFSKALAQEIGDDLALLIYAATEDRQQKANTYVVRVAPVHRVSSFLSEEANVEPHESLLRSMQQVVRSLLQLGVLLQHDHDRAIAFLKQHDRGWPNEELIPLGSTLYLDDLAVSYIHHLKLWECLADAPYTLLVHEDAQREAHALVKHKANLKSVADAVECARRFIADGYKSGVVEYLPLPAKDSDEEIVGPPKFLLPQLLDHSKQVGLIVTDDRAANKFSGLTTSQGVSISIASSLDLIDLLLYSNRIDKMEWRRYRTQLRRWGYQFVPATVDELLTALETSFTQDGQLIESIDARSIRESMLLAQSAGLLNFPMESYWLLEQHRLLVEAVQAVWLKYEDDHRASVYSAWLMELYSWLGYASSMLGEWTSSRKRFMDATEVSRLLFISIPKRRRPAYQSWLENRYLEEILHTKPLIFDEICFRSKETLKGISEFAYGEDIGVPRDQASEVIVSLTRDHFGGLPKIVRDRLISDSEVLSLLAESRSMTLTVNTEGQPGFDLVALYASIRESLSSEKDVSIRDNNGDVWEIFVDGNEQAEVRRNDGTDSFLAQHSRLVSEVANRRLKYLSELIEDVGIPTTELQRWIQLASSGPFDPLLFPELDSDLQDCMRSMSRHIEATLQSGQASQADIVPLKRRYFERLVEPWRGEPTVNDYAIGLRKRKRRTGPAAQLRDELVWSIHSTLAPIDAVAELHPSDIQALVDELIGYIDLWSLTGLIEAICKREDAFTSLTGSLEKCVESFLAVLDERSGRLTLTCNLAMLVDGLVATSGLLDGKPVYFRRLSSFAHAAIIERCVLKCGIEPSAFAEWSESGKLRFHIATLADLPSSPRWSGFMMSTGQLKQELLGRVVSAFTSRESQVSGTELGRMVFGGHPSSLHSQRLMLFSALPGPLEGDIPPAAEAEAVFAEQIDAAIDSEDIRLPMKATSIAHIIGFGLPPVSASERLVEIVKKLLAYDFTHDDEEIVHAMILRVSLAASISRNPSLGDSVVQLMYRRTDFPFQLRVIAGLTACGWEENDELWSKLAGDFIARLAQEPILNYQAEFLLFVATTLSDLRPSICPAIGSVVARLKGFLSRGGQPSIAMLPG